MSTAHSARAWPGILAAACAAISTLGAEPAPPAGEGGHVPPVPAATAQPSSRVAEEGGKTRFSCSQEPWAGDDVRFVNDMLLTWRPDYQKLSPGEFRVYVRDVLLGLQPPGERYAIQTGKKGSILFERKDGDVHCTIERP